MRNRLGMILVTFLLSLYCLTAFAEVNAGLVAHFTFDEGAGDVLHDRSGNGHDGKIVGAQWIRQDGHSSLLFRGHGDYVDLSNEQALKIAGDSTILAWVRLDASPYPDDATNWTIFDCEDYRKEGVLLRIDGGSSRVTYRVNQAGGEQSGFGATALDNHKVHFVGVVRRGDTAWMYVNGVPDGAFAVKPPVFGAAPVRISAGGQSFSGAILDVTVFNRALDGNEMADWYWRGAERYRKDGAQRGQLFITPYIYYSDKEALADVDFLGVMPLAADEKVSVALAHRGGNVIAAKDVGPIPKEARAEYAFSLDGLANGEYELRAELKGGSRTAEASAAFSLPAPPLTVPSPTNLAIGPIPVTPPPPAYQVKVTPGGGIALTVGTRTLPLESTFSFPAHSGANKLVCGPSKNNEPEWQVTSKQIDSATQQVDARGKFYSLVRRIKSETGRIVVSDTVTNRASEPMGIMFHNRLEPGDTGAVKAYLAGKETSAPVADYSVRICPTALLSTPGLGVGLVALDDVYIVQARGAFDPKEGVDLFSNEFALAAGVSYTLEWAVYLNATGDYYDFINAIRKDEQRNQFTVEGPLVFLPGTQQKRDAALVPGAPYFDIRNPRYATLFCLSWCTDDPAISVEGIEFTHYPKERRQVRAMMDKLAAVRPGVKGMFHVAHQLYATNRPNDHFPDSKVVDAQGNQTVYGHDYAHSSYFSRERFEQNWRWWIYYPTTENSFGKALLDSVDVMMDEMGAKGVFADGFLWGYGGEYTYDRWDGHSADIDSETHTIKRKKASTLLISQDAMAAWVRKIRQKDGVVIANGVVPTRSLRALTVITDKEVAEGPDVAILPTPITLGNPDVCRTEKGLYRDVLNKLRWGNLYFYYNEHETLAYESVPKQMYPITVQEVHGGYVKGKERLVTMRSGAYGWPESRDLHLAYRYDSRGHRIRPGFITAVDAASVRTQVSLGDKETAVLVRIPVSIESSTPVNAVVERYDDRGLSVTVNGKGSIRIIMPDGKSCTEELSGQKEIALGGQ